MEQELQVSPRAPLRARGEHGAPLRAAVPAICLAIFLGVWICAALDPRYRLVWALENLPTVVLVPAVVLAHRRLHLSNTSYVLLTVFLVLHTLGSHTSYTESTIGAWVQDAIGWGRNPYDRIMHFLFGLLFLQPLRQLAFPPGRRRGLAAELAIAFSLVACWALLYELLEWAVAALSVTSLGQRVRGAAEAGAGFLALQGDFWDAQKDMALACLGALIAAGVAAAWARVGARRRRRRAT